MIVSYEEYKALYTEDGIAEPLFNRLNYLAERKVKDVCTGVDGYSKLDRAFPGNEETVNAVHMAVCAVINLMARIDKANASVESGQAVKSKSAGNESITYSDSGMIASVTSDKAAQGRLIAETAEEYLRGSQDRNGINLLYRGAYPFR